MKTWDEINVYEKLSLEDFLVLFAHLPLTEEEKSDLNESYYPMYQSFLDAEVEPRESWIAIRNIFVIKNKQIARRLEKSTNI
jgi:hypothetical protein